MGTRPSGLGVHMLLCINREAFSTVALVYLSCLLTQQAYCSYLLIFVSSNTYITYCFSDWPHPLHDHVVSLLLYSFNEASQSAENPTVIYVVLSVLEAYKVAVNVLLG